LIISKKEDYMKLIKTNDGVSLRPFGGLVDEWFGQALGRWFDDEAVATPGFASFPPVNIRETKDAYVLDMVAPGWAKEDIKVNLEGKTLFISAQKAEKKAEKEEGSDKVIRREYVSRSFKRSFTVDDSIDTQKIDAKYENGILKVVLAKKEENQVQNKEITIS